MNPLFTPRGIVNVSKLTGLTTCASTVTQGLTVAPNQSFRYHIPRRILGIVASIRVLSRAQHTDGSRSRKQDAGRRTFQPWSQTVGSHTQTILRWHVQQARYSSTCTTIGLNSAASCWARQKTGSIIALGRSSLLQTRSFSGDVWRYASENQKTSPEDLSKASQTSSQPTPSSKAPNTGHEHHFYDRLYMPQFHRPTKEELMAAATGFWSRMRVRFKWSTIRSVRPYNLDEITGFLSWILFGHILWLVIGTTTFVSLAIFAINTIFAQETLAGWIANYLTRSSGMKVVFESAVVPKWGDGVITFKNVFVSRRPGQNKKAGATKGSADAAAIAAAAQEDGEEEDTNYTQFDITIGEVNVTLSFRKWWNSKGPLQNVEVKHVRGVVDRTHVHWTGEYVDPKSYRHEHNPGDFEIDSFKIEDLLVTIHQPQGFRPFPVSIYNAELPRLRKQWMFFDLLSANSMTGEYDKSLFTIHPRQTNSYTGAQLNDSENTEDEPWRRQSRIRLDGLNIDHLNRNVEGPFSWIHEGNVDIVADIMIPNDTDESVMKVMSDFYDRMEATLTSKKHLEPPGEDVDPKEQVPQSDASSENNDDKRFMVMDLRVHLNDVRAVVPLFTKDLSYVNNALIRPIVAYINSRRTFIPINCRVVKRASDFDGSWTIFDSGLMDDLSAEVYDAFARDVSDEQARLRRFKQVGLWSLQLAFQAIFLGMKASLNSL
jgi:mitochondrial distribution and morphology protein 31